MLKAGEKVLVCGIPCQMAALRSFLKKDYENLIIVDLICRGINSPKVFSKWLSFLEDEYGAKVQHFRVKSKELGWRKLTTKVVFENGKYCMIPMIPTSLLLVIYQLVFIAAQAAMNVSLRASLV